jgi:hypothetical protein
MKAGGLSDGELLKRLRALYSDGIVGVIEKKLKKARSENRDDKAVAIHARYTYRMHDLSEFMRTLLQRITRWYNRENRRTGTLTHSFFKKSPKLLLTLISKSIKKRQPITLCSHIQATIEANPSKAVGVRSWRFGKHFLQPKRFFFTDSAAGRAHSESGGIDLHRIG